MGKVRIYIDGSSSNNGGYFPDIPITSSFGFVVVGEDDQVIYEFVRVEKDRTNNQMELEALIASFLYLRGISFTECTIYSDSQYALNSLVVKKPKKNLDLVKRLHEASLGVENVKLEWVKGHNGNKWNEYIDKKIVYARSN